MPSKKPKVQALLNEKTYKKLKSICEKETRSESQMIGLIINQFIENYESINGNITINNPNIIENTGKITINQKIL